MVTIHQKISASPLLDTRYITCIPGNICLKICIIISYKKILLIYFNAIIMVGKWSHSITH